MRGSTLKCCGSFRYISTKLTLNEYMSLDLKLSQEPHYPKTYLEELKDPLDFITQTHWKWPFTEILRFNTQVWELGKS